MPTRPVENPQRPGMGGSGITNLGDYPDFEGMGDWGAGDWPGTASMNPWDVPDAIDGDWSMNFRPGNIEGAYGQYQDWAAGQGQDALPLDRFNDLQYQQGVGPIPDAPGPGADPAGLIGAGYGLDFNPGQTANQDWRLQYGISDPSGDQTGWALSGGDPYGGFPWVSGDQSFVRQEEYDAPALEMERLHRGDSIRDDNTIADVPKLPWEPDPNERPTEFDLEVDEDDPAGGIPTHLQDLWMALTGQIPGKGDVARTMSEVPLVPEGWQDETRVVVGDDPLSEGIYSALAQLTGQSGGVADTPLARQAEQGLRQIIFQGGRGAENLSDLGYDTQAALQEIIDAQGARAAETTTPLGDETQQNLRELMASGGQLPADTQRRAMEMETLRDPIEAFRQAQLAQGQATMAGRGLLGQGPELDYLSRLEESLAPMYAGAGQQLALSEAERADTRYRDALQQSNLMAMEQARLREGRLATALGEAGDFSIEQAELRESRLSDALTRATGWNEEAARNLVNAARAGTEYQDMLGNLALENIRENRLWNDMLFKAGIERAEALDAIQRGNLDALLPVIQEYLQAASRIGDAYVVGSS
jgi:hypothetical protein